MTPSLLRSLPYPALMKQRLRAFAMLDAIVAPDMRSFEYHPKWDAREEVGAFKDGEGNFFFAWFNAKGAVVRGFDHESPMSAFRKEPPEPWPGLWDGLPSALAAAKEEPAFGGDEITFACWALGREAEWRTGRAKLPKGKDPDGAIQTLGCLSRAFKRWADAYYGDPLDGAALAAIWKGAPLDERIVAALNPSFDAAAIREEAELLKWKVSLTGAAAPQSPAKAGPPTPPPQSASAAPKARSFGQAEFKVRCEPDRVRMLIRENELVAEAKADVYEEIFDWVKARLKAAQKATRKRA